MANVQFSENTQTLSINGDISFATVSQLQKKGDHILQQLNSHTIMIDFADVTYNDITGLALVISWLRQCARRKIKANLLNLPPSILRIAEVCGVSDLIKQ